MADETTNTTTNIIPNPRSFS